ncbi:MAG: hypothetical protein A2287_10385 [Candidatus Melainabacteria bacterium RIFOXYA12_FULL_32_12]|nr:MAG: hypothetical protein A2104_06555 [Candidatus Melainabacteria bacterium GWF2_32_7]OGI22868.1 MAG: hypothetical protein A2255_05540 [Candidatus Melainabacteria bacterium RIFOXYA2_FULL_32_9]OGI29188.1 MAG: hypothetical protein A2287_10385 [Candidatus Melainabacteria bacterium RIFOXYA12_FULL_32_12]
MNISSFLSTAKNTSLGISTACMIGRPIITMSNNKVPIETRKYTATREFFTELFNIPIIYLFVSAAENLVSKLVANQQGIKDFSKEMLDKIRLTEMTKLGVQDQKVKTALLLTSFVGTAATVAVITPLLNNALLGKIIDRLPMGKSKKQEQPSQVNANVFEKFNKLKLNG